MFGREEFEQLAPVVDGLSLMTYDYSSGVRWVHGTGDATRGFKLALIQFSELCAVVVIGRALALRCPGSETVSSSLHQTLSGGRRFCLDSICTALILQAREQSQSWEQGELKL